MSKGQREDMATSVPRRRSNRKSDILECFAELVAERGYDGVSLRDIAERLEISKGTILHHFGSKDQMLERLHADYMTRRLAEARAILELVHSPAARLSAIVHQNMAAEAHERPSTVAFAREIMRFASEESMNDVREMRAEYTSLLCGIIREGMEEGAFALGDPDIITLQVIGMCNWSWTWYRPEGRWTGEEIAEQYVQVILGGLSKQQPDPTVRRELATIPGLVAELMERTRVTTDQD
jgi:TetR/AcrR family transcriptional regulator, cholesterol catabolism regulator